MASCTITSKGVRNAFDFLTLEIFSLLVASNVLHFFLQYLGQPSVISQFLAGIIAGKTVMLRITKFGADSGGLANQMDDIVRNCRVFFLFLIGLEMDIIHLRQNFRKSTLIAFVCIATCIIITLPLSSILYHLLANENANFTLFVLMISLFLSSTASPVLIRIVTELKLTYSNTGKLAIASAIVNDIAVVILLAFYSIEKKSEHSPVYELKARIHNVVMWLIVTVLPILFMTWMVKTCNKCHPEKRYISDFKLWGILLLIALICNAMDTYGYNSTSMSFLLGLLMPREGRTTRVILEKLTFPVHHLIIPLYFSGILVKMDLHDLVRENVSEMITAAFLIAILCIIGKVIGTIIVARFFLKMHPKDAAVLGILVSVKGHLDTVIIAMGAKFELWSNKTVMLLTFIIIINTFIACPVVRLIVSWERKAYRYNPQSLQHLEREDQLRIVTCVHRQQEVQEMLTISSLFVGDNHSFTTISLLHLVELTRKYAFGLLYSQQSPHYSSWERGIDDSREVGIAAAMFTNNNAISIQHSTVVSSYGSMHEDICMHAEEVRACLVLLPFHKEKGYDGKMVCRREERHQLNLKVFQQAPCTIGIFVDRSTCRSMSVINSSINTSIYTKQLNTTIIDLEMPEPQTPTARLHQVVAIFFGGPDDREAASFMARAAQHPSVNATLVRFLLETQNLHIDDSSSRLSELFSAIVDLNTEHKLDEHFLADYQQRYVKSGLVTYIERHVSNGSELVNSLSSMAGLFTLFIVGKEGPHLSALMMGDWEECPELGPIGDLLASEDIITSGSVLVLQQHKVSKINPEQLRIL